MPTVMHALAGGVHEHKFDRHTAVTERGAEETAAEKDADERRLEYFRERV